MRLWIDVYDAAGNRLGDGPVTTVKSANVTRALDGAGQFTVSVVGVDPQALELLTNERRVQIWVEDTGGVRILGEGILVRRQIEELPSGVGMSISGPDILTELKRRNSLLARIYNQELLSSVIGDLVGLAPGWTAVIDPAIAGDTVDARFDGVSIIKAMQEINKRYGYHFRVSDAGSRIIEISRFGESNGLRIHKAEVITQELISNEEVLIVERIRTAQDSESVVNWVLPLGAGEGIAALTLEKSTRSSPYTIQSMVGPDGTTLYYLADASSVATYGEIQKVVQFKEIAVLINSESDIENAANALYDAAVEWMSRHKDPIESYSVTVKNVKESILPGDKIHMNYQAQVRIGSQLVTYLSVRGDFYVMRLTETVSDTGSSSGLEISNIDRHEDSMAAVVVSSIESIETRNLKPATTSSTRSYVYDREIAPTFNAVVPVEFTDATLSVQRVRLRLKTTAFRATAKSAESQTTEGGSPHSHVTFYDEGAGGGAMGIRKYADGSTGGVLVEFYSNTVSDLETGQDRNTHTHAIPETDLVFGISDDDETPRNITVFINGENLTSDLFGSATLAASGGEINTVADSVELTEAILNTGDGLRQVHEIEIRCSSGQGRVEATVEIFEVVQAIKLA